MPQLEHYYQFSISLNAHSSWKCMFFRCCISQLQFTLIFHFVTSRKRGKASNNILGPYGPRRHERIKSLCLIVTKPPFLQFILCCISNLFPHGHVVGNFEISQPYVKQIYSQNCCFENSKPYLAMGDMVSQLDTPLSVLNCKSRFDFSDMFSLRCFMIYLYAFSFSTSTCS